MQEKTFAEILKEKRLESGYRQTQVAEELFISKSTYSHYETGERTPTIENLIKIAAFFNMNPMELLGSFISDKRSYSINYLNFMHSGKYALSTKELRLINDYGMLNTEEQAAIENMIRLFKKNNTYN